MPKLDLETHALVGELASGDVLVALAASPDLASVGDEDEGLLAARLYLSETLSRVAPDEIVRFDLPRDTALHQTTVLVPREDLARRWAITTPISVTSLVLPDPPDARGLRHRWVMLLRPRHTFYVPADEDLDEAVAHEVKRLCAAREITPEQYLELLPLRRERLAPVRVTFERGMSSAQARAADGKKRLGVLEAKKAAFAVLESVATLVRPGSPRPFPLRDAERELLGRLLGGVDRASVLLVGPERVGKSGLFAAWHERERAEGGTRPVFATSGARLIAGMSGFGQWQERVRRVMEAAHTLDAILYFDDFADLFAERPGGAIDVPGAMRPWIEDGRVRVVGEIRDTILDRIEARNAALFACFGRVRLEPLDAAAAKSVVVAVLEHDKKSHVALPAPGDAALDALIELAERYLPYESFPGKAVRLMSELRAAVAASVGSRASEPDFSIGATDVHAWFSARTGVPTFLLTDAERLDVDDTVRALGRRLVGQEEAVRRVAELVSVVKAGLSPAGKPLATLLFVGPTGVGKTELARALAELLFGDEGRLARFDMSEYADAHAADRLFRGLDGGEGLLTRRVREEPFSVVLLDEIEKAHHGVFDLLLQVCGEGRLTDGVGRTAFFHNAFVILTSNLGATDARPVAGFGGAAHEPAAHYIRVVDETFRPELVNRIDRIIAFRSLDAAEARAVTRMVTSRAAKRRGLVERDIDLDVSDEALDLLAREGASATYGASGSVGFLYVSIMTLKPDVPSRPMSSPAPRRSGGREPATHATPMPSPVPWEPTVPASIVNAMSTENRSNVMGRSHTSSPAALGRSGVSSMPGARHRAKPLSAQGGAGGAPKTASRGSSQAASAVSGATSKRGGAPVGSSAPLTFREKPSNDVAAVQQQSARPEERAAHAAIDGPRLARQSLGADPHDMLAA